MLPVRCLTNPELLTASEADIFSGGRDSNVLVRWQKLSDSSRGHLLSEADRYGIRITRNILES